MPDKKKILKILFTLLLIAFSTGLSAQKSKKRSKNYSQINPTTAADSMFVNLYTDSLKKGTYNYINVDGKLENGRYVPLDTSEVTFHASDGKFYGNSLFIQPEFKKEKVTIEIMLKKDTAQHSVFDMYIKKAPDPELKSENEILDNLRDDGRR